MKGYNKKKKILVNNPLPPPTPLLVDCSLKKKKKTASLKVQGFSRSKRLKYTTPRQLRIYKVRKKEELPLYSRLV